MYHYKTEGVCSRSIDIELDGNLISHIDFEGGCSGNLQALSRLVKGKTIEEVSDALSGIKCGTRETSCSDQLVKALNEALSGTDHS